MSCNRFCPRAGRALTWTPGDLSGSERSCPLPANLRWTAYNNSIVSEQLFSSTAANFLNEIIATFKLTSTRSQCQRKSQPNRLNQVWQRWQSTRALLGIDFRIIGNAKKSGKYQGIFGAFRRQQIGKSQKNHNSRWIGALSGEYQGCLLRASQGKIGEVGWSMVEKVKLVNANHMTEWRGKLGMDIRSILSLHFPPSQGFSGVSWGVLHKMQIVQAG